MKRIYKQESKGFTIISVIITMAILAILGTTILLVSITETKLSIRDKKRIQAYYLARAGVEATTAWLMTSDNPSQLSGESHKVYLDNTDHSKYFTVEIIGDFSDPEIIVKATGSVDGVEAQAARLIRTGPQGNEPVFKYTLYGETKIELSGNSYINGDVATPYEGGVIFKEKNLDPKRDKSPQKVTYPPFNIPTGEYRGNLASNVNKITFNGVENRTLVYDNFVIGNNKILEIDTGNEGEGNVNIVMNKFQIGNSSSCLTVTGKNRLNIFVKNSAILDGNINAIPIYKKNGKVDHFEKDDPSKLIIFVDRNAESVSWSSNQMFNCFFYAPGVNINVTGTPDFRGAIIGNIITLRGNFNVDGYNPEDSDIEFDDLPVTFISEGPWIKP